jgi:prolyl 4-hydroxylase
MTAPKPNETTQPSSSNLWIMALAALLAGLITKPLSQMYVLVVPSLSSERQLSNEEVTLIETATTVVTPEYSCSPEVLSNFLHDFEVPGMHVICLNVANNVMTMYPKAQQKHTLTENLEDSSNWVDVRSVLQDKLDLPTQSEMKQPWALFSPTGQRLQFGEVSPVDTSTEELFSLGMFLLLEGGQWVWPGVRKGFIRHIQLDEERNTTLKTLSVHPLVFSVDGFLENEECDWIRETAEPHMAKSGVSLMDRDKGKPATDWRTSETTFLTQKTPEILEIDRRTSLLVRIPQNHQEPPQVLRYVLNARYDPHTDYFDPALYANDKGTMHMIANGRKNRMATVLWYLSNVAKGGETTFPQIDNGPLVSNQRACHVGLQVKPEKGKVIIFYSLKADGKFDPLSLHGACPVLEGVKWAANKWVWNEPWSM